MSTLSLQSLFSSAQGELASQRKVRPMALVPSLQEARELPASFLERDLVSVLRERSQQTPERLAYSYQTERGEVRLTYGELDRQARVIAARLQALGGANARALLLYPPGPEFLAGFFGCLYAGVIAVPAYPPRAPFRAQDRAIRRILSIAKDASPRFVLTTEATRAKLLEVSEMFSTVETWIASDVDEGPGAEKWQSFVPSLEALAFLQYTSGSTGTPKGVMVSHGNILHNERMITQSFGQSDASVCGGWLPVFHDMGLIGLVLQPMFAGCPSHLISPLAFMKRPFRWLELISRHRITTSGAPDFAYRLLAECVTEEEKAQLDLSSWKVAFTGAEPVRHETLERFSAAFASCGFRRSAFFPTYGLAEATLFVTGGSKQQEPVFCAVQRSALERGLAAPVDSAKPEDQRVLVGCGQSADGQRMLVVRTDTLRPASEGEVGEIWVSGPHVTGGYWNRPRETAERFGAAVAGSEDKSFYRTGDLGFLQGGELFITGRASDLIIIRGVNHYPEDLELTVERVDERFGLSCVVSADIDGEEQLVVVQEVQRGFKPEETAAVAAAVRKAIVEAHELVVHTVVLMPRGRIPRTSSGKVQRRACREMFLKGELEAIGTWSQAQVPAATASAPAPAPAAPASSPGASQAEQALSQWLIARVARLLRVQPHEVNPQRQLSEYGLDSAASVLIAGELERLLDREIPATVSWDYPTIASLAQYLASSGAVPPSLLGANASVAPVSSLSKVA